MAALAAEQRFDYLVIESTGISEPLPVAATFSLEDGAGGSLADYARLDTMARAQIGEPPGIWCSSVFQSGLDYWRLSRVVK